MKNLKEVIETTYVSYEVYGGRKLLFGHKADVCYSPITYGALPRNTKRIETWISLYRCPFEEDEVKEWISDMNDWGFPIEYDGIVNRQWEHYQAVEDKRSYQFTIHIKGKEPKGYIIYKERLHLNTALILVRYLWERGISTILGKYLKYKELMPEADKWELFQMAHIGVATYFNSNHTVREDRDQSFITKDYLFNQMKDHSIFIREDISVSQAWRGQWIELEREEKKKPKVLYEKIKNLTNGIDNH